MDKLEKKSVGSGFISSLVERCTLPRDVIVYAAGVSNVGSTSQDDYYRDRRRLQSFVNGATTNFVYVSSSDLSEYEPFTRYLRHKQELEEIVLASCKGIIFRAPQVICRKSERLSFLGSFNESIKNKKEITVWSDILRKPIDADDVVKSFSVIKSLKPNAIVDIAPKHGILASDVVKLLDPSYRNITLVKKSPKLKRSNDNIVYAYNTIKSLADVNYCEMVIKNAMPSLFL